MIEKQAVKNLLAGLGWSAGLAEEMVEELAAISAVAEFTAFTAGATIFREGDPNPFLYLIERGRVGLDMHVPGRGRVRILSVGAGEMLAWSAVLGRGVMTVSAEALEDTRAIAASGPQLLQICGANHELGYQLMQRMAGALAQRLVATRLQLLDLFAEPSSIGPARS
jgi:CRP-like cAMP-binding protein